jgi:hypothetical protein
MAEGTLSIIFERSKNPEKYTKNALLYQKILTFPLSGADFRIFTRWKLCKWLKINYRLFKKRSVESLQQLVGRKIDVLLELHLIHEIGTQLVSTGSSQTPVYAFDATTYVLGWLIESS